MGKKRQFLSALLCLSFELLMTAGVFFLAVWIRDQIPISSVTLTFDKESIFTLFPVILLIWTPLLWFYGSYRAQRTDRLLYELARSFAIVAIGSILLVVISFILQQFGVSRLFLVLFAGMEFFALCAVRAIFTSFRRHSRKRGYDREYVLVVGTGKRAREHAKLLERYAHWGIEVLGFLSEQKISRDSIGEKPILGSLEKLELMLRNEVVDEVHFAVSRPRLERLDEALRICEEIGVRVRIVLAPFGEIQSKIRMDHLSGVPLLTLSTTPDRDLELLMKRMFDIVASFFGLLVLSPVYVVAAILVKCTSKGPIFFKQKRLGMNGRIFHFYKFRTMVENAEELKSSLESQNEMDGPVFKIKEDPRVTKIGRLLRKTSIDELPQIWNVLRGDMSLVGPRPPVPSEVQKYERWHRRRLSMRPGITCIWQISGRNEISFQQWMKMDLEYIDNWSLILDFKILAKTVPVVIGTRGAS